MPAEEVGTCLFEDFSPLQQEYSYLAEGDQSYVFLSQDKKYVLKFFKKRGKRSQQILTSFLPVFQRKQKKWKRQLSSCYKSYELAYEKIREETALLGLHFKKTTSFPKCVLAYEGKKEVIDLNLFSFVLQRKADDFLETFRKDPASAKRAMEELLESRARRGIRDQVGGFVFNLNYGFIEGKAVLFDLGRICYDEAVFQNPEEEIAKMQDRLDARLSSLALMFEEL